MGRRVWSLASVRPSVRDRLSSSGSRSTRPWGTRGNGRVPARREAVPLDDGPGKGGVGYQAAVEVIDDSPPPCVLGAFDPIDVNLALIMNPPALGNPAHKRTDGITQNGEAPPPQASAYRARHIGLSFIGAIDAPDFLGRRGGLGASDSSGNDRFLGAHMIRAQGGPPPHVLPQRPAVPGDKELSAVKQYNGRITLEALGHICGISIGRATQ